MSTADRERSTSGRGVSRRRVLGGAAALGLAAPSLAALEPVGFSTLARAAQDAAPKPGGILKIGLQADPTALDPQKRSLTAIWKVVEQIYNRLTRVRADLTVEPKLAESWEISPDGKGYTFKPRAGVTFHDGTPLKASDVKFSFERLVDPATASTSAADLASMTSVEAPDESTVVLTLEAPNAALLSALSNQSCVVLSEQFVTANNGDISQTRSAPDPSSSRSTSPIPKRSSRRTRPTGKKTSPTSTAWR